MNAVVNDIQSQTTISLTEFVADFGDDLLRAVSAQNPPVYSGVPNPVRERVMEELSRKPFPAQREVVHAVTSLLVDSEERAAIINAEMGTGKTMMAIAVAAVMYQEGYRRILVLSPPHLVYKWRREILMTVPNAKVWILNGADTLSKLILMKQAFGIRTDVPEFFILGRVRMRMGFHWRPAVAQRFVYRREEVCQGDPKQGSYLRRYCFAACSDCSSLVYDVDGNPLTAEEIADDKRLVCRSCKSPLWTLIHPRKNQDSPREVVLAKAMRQIPTIGPKTAGRLLDVFGVEMLESMLSDNIYEFVNLMDEQGDLMFSDRQAQRIERGLATLEFSFGQGGYQPTEFIKRYLPNQYFDLMVVDEGHEYKNDGSAQGQAMGVLCSKVSKALLLTGTLMGGYASDLFFLLWRLNPQRMIEDDYRYSESGSLASASMDFMRHHGVLKDIYRETDQGSHRTSRGKKTTVRTVKAPGFGPQGIVRYVLPITAFLKLRDIGNDILPPYTEHFIDVPMTQEQSDIYGRLKSRLTSAMREALRHGDNSLMGVVLNVLLAWPDTCFREEIVKHPRSRQVIAMANPVFVDDEISPKEQILIDKCLDAARRGRRVLVYTVYTGTRDTASRLKVILQNVGLRTAVLRATVPTVEREDWILGQVDRGLDVLICNPELVKTGLDMLEFPSIVFMQTGYNVYTVQQAARRSWRIGQDKEVEVWFLGYRDTAQIDCLRLMGEKITVSQSTSGDIPENGLEVLNQGSDSVEMALAKSLAMAA